jgi:hypothetical protein
MTCRGDVCHIWSLPVLSSHVGCRDCCRSTSLQVRVATFEYSSARDSTNQHYTDGTVHIIPAPLPMYVLANVLLSDRKRKYHSHRCIVRATANQTPLNGEAISLHNIQRAYYTQVLSPVSVRS